MKDWKNYRKGYVRIRVCAPSPERFLNLCAHHQIFLWNLVYRENAYEMSVSISGFYRMQGICRKTHARVKIIGKYGLPFFFYRNRKRKAFFLGIFLGFFILCLLSRHIWNIHVEGNVHNSTQSILNYLEDLEVRHGVLKKNLDCAYIAQQMRGEFPDITWVSARISGSRLILEIKENETVLPKGKEQAEVSDLVSDKTGTIVSMVTRKGRPLKKAGETCEKGEVLVSGRLELYNDSKEISRYEYTDADADVYVQYDLEYYQEFSMNYKKPVYTGEKKKGYVLQAGNYYFLLKGKPKWQEYDTVTGIRQLRITENFKLPVFFGTSTDYEYKTKTCTYTKEEAKKKAGEKLQTLLKSLEEKGVQISGNRVKIGIHNGVCTAQGTLTVIEKTGIPARVQILEQPAERNADVNE